MPHKIALNGFGRLGRLALIAVIRNGSVYIEQWQDRDHFPDIAEGSVFPVWVRVEKINERV